MDIEGVIKLLKSIKEFRVNDELPFNSIDYLTIDDAIEFLAAQQSVQADKCPTCDGKGWFGTQFCEGEECSACEGTGICR
jgi:hypothetical protein